MSAASRALPFATFLVWCAVIGAPLRDRRLWLTSLLAVGVAFVATSRLAPASYVDVVESARSLVSEVATAVGPSRAEAAVEGNRATLRARYGLDPTTLLELAGRLVAHRPGRNRRRLRLTRN